MINCNIYSLNMRYKPFKRVNSIFCCVDLVLKYEITVKGNHKMCGLIFNVRWEKSTMIMVLINSVYSQWQEIEVRRYLKYSLPCSTSFLYCAFCDWEPCCWNELRLFWQFYLAQIGFLKVEKLMLCYLEYILKDSSTSKRNTESKSDAKVSQSSYCRRSSRYPGVMLN